LVREFNIDLDKLNAHNLALIKKEGFMFPSDNEIINIPEEEKQFPTDVSNMDNETLLNKMATFTALYASVAVKEALAIAETNGYERELDITKSRVMQLSSSTKITEKRQEASANDDVVRLQEKLTVAESRLKLLSALRNAYEKAIFLYSRALTVRNKEMALQ